MKAKRKTFLCHPSPANAEFEGQLRTRDDTDSQCEAIESNTKEH